VSPSSSRTKLWEMALELTLALVDEFVAPVRPPVGVDAQQLRVSSDPAVRTRLLNAGVAEILQSPRGRQRIKWILRLYPAFNAPRRVKRGIRPGRTAAVAAGAVLGLPTVEDLNALVARILHVEGEVSAELEGRVNADISRLKKRIGVLDGDDFEVAYRELETAVRQRRQLAVEVREEAFRRVDADGSFEAGRFLSLIARAPR
jgi:hypothetical protein